MQVPTYQNFQPFSLFKLIQSFFRCSAPFWNWVQISTPEESAPGGPGSMARCFGGQKVTQMLKKVLVIALVLWQVATEDDT